MLSGCEEVCLIEGVCDRHDLFKISTISNDSCLIYLSAQTFCVCRPSIALHGLCKVLLLVSVVFALTFFLTAVILLLYIIYKSKQRKRQQILETETGSEVSRTKEDEEEIEESTVSENQGDIEAVKVPSVRFKKKQASNESLGHNKSDLKAVLDKLLLYAQKKELKMIESEGTDVTTPIKKTGKKRNTLSSENVSQISFQTAQKIKRLLSARINEGHEIKRMK